MENSNPVTTPIDSSSELRKSQDSDKRTNATRYRKIIGSNIHASIHIRRDIRQRVSRMRSTTSLQLFLRYLNGTIELRV